MMRKHKLKKALKPKLLRPWLEKLSAMDPDIFMAISAEGQLLLKSEGFREDAKTLASIPVVLDGEKEGEAVFKTLKASKEDKLPICEFVAHSLQEILNLASARRDVADETLVQYREVSLLHRAAVELNQSLDIDQTTNSLLLQCRKVMSPEMGIVFSRDNFTGNFSILDSFGSVSEYSLERISETPLFREIVSASKGEIVNDLSQESRWKEEIPELRSILCVPLKSPGYWSGALVLANTCSSVVFSALDLQRISSISSVAATALANAYHFEKVQRMNEHKLVKLWRSVENSPASIVITDTEACIEYVNPAFTSITGYGSEEVIGRTPGMLKSGVHDQEFYRNIWKTITSGKSWRGEMCNRKKNGELFWEQVSISPVKDEQGGVINYVAVKEDISDRKDLEQLKENVDRIMRHDLKGPLNGIIGIPQLIQDEDDLSEEQLDLLQTIENAGQKMLEMIDHSLDLFKIETGDFNYVPEQIDVISVLITLIKEYGSRLSEKRLKANIWFNDKYLDHEQEVMIRSCKRLLYPLLSNLLVNAIEASPKEEEIKITVTDSDHVLLSIQNKGAVPEGLRNCFFEKYKTCGKPQGTGLGTYSAQLLAKAMHYGLGMQTSDQEDLTRVTLQIPKQAQ